MNIYENIEAMLHAAADLNHDGNLNRADIALAVDGAREELGTGWKGYAVAALCGFVVGALLIWAF